MKIIKYLILSFYLIGCMGRKPEKTGLEGTQLPSFNMILADTIFFNTANIPEGNPVVLFYFGPKCPYSRSQMEEIIDNISSLKKIRFYVFTTAPVPEMLEFHKHYQLKKYSNITTGIDYTNFFKYYFKAKGVPYIAIYNKKKRLIESYIGKIRSRLIIEVLNENEME